MRNRIFYLIVFLGFSMLVSLGCGGFGQKAPATKTSRATISIKLPPGVSLKSGEKVESSDLAIAAVTITKISLEVTGGGMEPINRMIPMDTLEISLDIPSGDERTFTVTIETSSGKFMGAETVDLLPGESVDIDIVVSLSLEDTSPPTTTASPAGGSYTSAQNVTLTCDDGAGSGCANTYYTIDDSDPTISSAVYSSPIAISTDTTLKLFSVDVAGNKEDVKTEIYAIATTGVPSWVGTWGVISLHHANDGSWYSESSRWTFNSDGTGTGTGTWNENGNVSTDSYTLTYTATPNSDGSMTMEMAGTAGDTSFTWSARIVPSDDGSVAIANGTSETDKEFMQIMIKIDASRTYTNADLSGEYYETGYMYDASPGAIKHNADAGIATFDGNGNLSDTGKSNGDGTIQDYSYMGTYSVSSDSSVKLGNEGSGYLSGDGNLLIWSDPVATDAWPNRFYLKKGDRAYSTSDLEGTWALAGFGDYEGTNFRAEFGTSTCDNSGNCAYSLKMRRSDGSISYETGTSTISVAPDGSFGDSIASGAPSYAGAIGNNGNTLIMNMSFDQTNPNDRGIVIAVRCNGCSDLAAWEGVGDQYSANGTYAYDSGTGVLTLNTINSDFVCAGPEVGTEQYTVSLLSETSMVLDQEYEEYGQMMNWTRPGGTSGDPVGAWTYIDTQLGNSYYITIQSDGSFTVAGNIVECGEASATSLHSPESYYVQLYYSDPDQTATSVTVTGPGITGSLSLTYIGDYRAWISTNTVDFGSTHPAPPLEYTFTVTDASGIQTLTDSVSCFVEEFATNLSPSGTVSGTPTFSWTGVGQTNVEYQVLLSDSSDRIWDSLEVTGTSVVYSGPALTQGETYYYDLVVSKNGGDCKSWAQEQESFTIAEGDGGAQATIYVDGVTVYTDPADFDSDTAPYGTPTVIDFEDATACAGSTIEGCNDFDGNYYSTYGLTLSNPNGYPFFIAPGGLYWNTSKSLSVGRIPGDPLSPSPYHEDDYLVITFDNPVKAAGLDIIDHGGGKDVEFKDSSGELIAVVPIPENYEEYRAFVGIISTTTLIKEVNVVDEADDGDDINYDNITFYQ